VVLIVVKRYRGVGLILRCGLLMVYLRGGVFALALLGGFHGALGVGVCVCVWEERGRSVGVEMGGAETGGKMGYIRDR
jgi:hypothetical protein